MWEAFKAILKAPFVDLSVWWVLTPVIILWIMLELYFGRYKNEKLGWNTALGNGISLTWITIALMKFLFENSRENFTWAKFIAVLLIMIYGLFVTIVTFKHKFSAKTTFLLADPSPIYFLSTVAVLWAYGSLILTWWVILDLVILYPIIVGIFALIRRFLPEAEGSESNDLGLGESSKTKDSFDLGGLKI